MTEIAQGALFVLACGLLYGLAVYLFRDQIWPEKITSTDLTAPDRYLQHGWRPRQQAKNAKASL